MEGDFRDRVKIYYDAEFTGLHRNTTLISIGAVAASGAYFYAEFNDYDKSQVTDWIQENVINNLQFNGHETYHSVKKFMDGHPILSRGRTPRSHLNIMMKGSRDEVKSNFLSWLKREYQSYGSASKIQFYTDCYAYDWMTLIDLICEDGDNLKLPDFIDYIPIDLSTALFTNNIDPDITREEFVSPRNLDAMKSGAPFKDFGESLKHNCLWDAAVCLLCFWELKKDKYTMSNGYTSYGKSGSADPVRAAYLPGGPLDWRP